MSTSDEGSPSPRAEVETVSKVDDTTPPFDPQLQRFVAWINLVDSPEVGLTLHVNGSVISGMLISVAQYYRMLITAIADASRLSDGSEPQSGLRLENFFRPALKEYEDAIESFRTTKELPPLPHHIHMRHAQTFVGATAPLGPGLWRGRLTEIDGWTIGNFGRIPPLEDADRWVDRGDNVHELRSGVRHYLIKKESAEWIAMAFTDRHGVAEVKDGQESAPTLAGAKEIIHHWEFERTLGEAGSA